MIKTGPIIVADPERSLVYRDVEVYSQWYRICSHQRDGVFSASVIGMGGGQTLRTSEGRTTPANEAQALSMARMLLNTHLRKIGFDVH